MTDFSSCPYPYVLTRQIPHSLGNDLDVLVRPQDFARVIAYFVSIGYKSSSHDHALGGRIPGMQINLSKAGCTKIDLHQDFTWRKSHYLDLALVWNQTDQIDQFLVIINTIFEKTYLLEPEYNFLRSFTLTEAFQAQAVKYGWYKSLSRFQAWWRVRQTLKYTAPIFVPIGLILLSYLEKFEPVSLLYYLFFRTRYALNRMLPYD